MLTDVFWWQRVENVVCVNRKSALAEFVLSIEIWNIDKAILYYNVFGVIHQWLYIQEGQHPLTGQRAANFRLLANQWAERRLVTQWRHGCRAMRRNVCNERRCFQCWLVPLRSDSKGTELPLPIYWYHSKGNWLRYNFAAESFYIMKLFSRLFVLYCRNCPKDDKFRYFIAILRKSGAA